MSEIKCVPIKYSKSWHSFSDPYNQIQNYLFELNIIMKDNESKKFIKLENEKSCNLIIIKDQIEFKNIKNFKITVKRIPDECLLTYQMSDNITQDRSYYIRKDENLFIEFSQNSNGYTICNCSFIGYDLWKISASPPN